MDCKWTCIKHRRNNHVVCKISFLLDRDESLQFFRYAKMHWVHACKNVCIQYSVGPIFCITHMGGSVVYWLGHWTCDLRYWVQFPAMPGYFWDRWLRLYYYFAGKLSWDITTTQVNSALLPPASLNRVPALAGVKAGKSPLPGGISTTASFQRACSKTDRNPALRYTHLVPRTSRSFSVLWVKFGCAN